MQIDLTQYSATQFSNYLLDTALIGNQDLESLENLASQYPYCQILHTLVAKAAIDTPSFDDKLEKAAIYATSREVLYGIIALGDELLGNEPRATGDGHSGDEPRATGNGLSGDEHLPAEEETLTIETVTETTLLTAEQEARSPKPEAESTIETEEITEKNILAFADENKHLVAGDGLSGFEPRATGDGHSGDEPRATGAEPRATGNGLSGDEPQATGDEPRATDDRLSGNEPLTAEKETSTIETETETTLLTAEQEARSPKPEAENPYLTAEQAARSPKPEAEITETETAEQLPTPQPQEIEAETPLLTTEDEAESPKLEAESPKSNFPQIETYDHHDSVLIKEIEEEAISAIIYQQSEITQAARSSQPKSPKLNEAQSPQPEANPSLYNDDKLPFTFLWWLNKTRKEHYETNQPYKNSQPDARSPLPETLNPQLNHQIAENILQLSALDKFKNDMQALEPVTKEDHIIKKFISQEPQIKPLSTDKIDSENKAKQSSADSGELVSETLAKIYVEQMLYVKALETYKKLSLKYPEKSTYFASQIKYLELKVN